MGSPTVSNAKPVPMENTEKKSFKTLIKSFFSQKKEKQKKIKQEDIVKDVKKEVKPEKNGVEAVLANFANLHLEKTVEDAREDEEDELQQFNFKTVERCERIHSNSSEDSGYSEKLEKDNDLAEELDKLELDDDGKKKKKKLKTVFVSRAPLRTKLCGYSAAPYTSRDQDPSRQISQINKHTLTGGQVIVNQCQTTDNLSEIDIACETAQQQSQFLQNDDPESYLEILFEYIHEDTNKQTYQNKLIADLEQRTIGQDEIIQLLQENNYQPTQIDSYNNNIETTMFPQNGGIQNEYLLNPAYTYPTPPRSENVPSPMSASPGSFYPSEYSLSPGRSPIYNSDHEKFGEIPPFDEEKEVSDKKARERTASISSMTMKQYKDLQKEIAFNFSKKDCCQSSRKDCKKLFQEHMQKLKMAERKDLCLKVAQIDIKSAYGTLQHILLSLSRGTEHVDLQCALFALICERLLHQDVSFFTGQAGLDLLKAAALRCPQKPLLTRYLVQCIRTAIKTNPSLVAEQDYVFHEVDALGDTLLIACARAGDVCADVLYELVQQSDQPPLFKFSHYNADGYTALHVACSQHSAASSRLHTVHVLLEHAKYSITEGDLKGRDTALHLAVNSANCDLQLVLLMFKQVDRKEWKNLAHCANLSSKTPIELARLATKSSARQNYPPEVLEFLKKCR